MVVVDVPIRDMKPGFGFALAQIAFSLVSALRLCRD
jgi:hypothetical protein